MNPSNFYPATSDILSGSGSTRGLTYPAYTITSSSSLVYAAGSGYRGSLLLIPSAAASIRMYYTSDNVSSVNITIAANTPLFIPDAIFYALTNVTNVTYQFIGEKFTYS